MTDLAIETLQPGDEARAIATLQDAFVADPVMRWEYPDDESYRRHFPAFVRAFGGVAFELSTAFAPSDFSAAALWIPPGAEPDAEVVDAIFRDTLVVEKHEDAFAVMDQLDAIHPHFEHWYLPWFGVVTAQQGAGLGSRFMIACLDILDRDGIPMYLESTNPRNVPFYERHGFRVIGKAQAGTCPPLACMLRDARA